MTGFAAVELAPELHTSPLLARPTVSAEQSGDPAACAMDVAVEVSLPDGTRVRVGKGAPAALLSDVFMALDRR